MNILICKLIGSYTDADVIFYLKKMGHHCREFVYPNLKDSYEDPVLAEKLKKEISAADFDFVYSTNYFPVIAKVCWEKGLKYLAWVYDSPPNLRSAETMEYETNRIFFFARYDYQYYKEMGLDTVYYMPLAVNVDRLSKIRPDRIKYGAEVSFVGSLYNSTFPVLKANMTPEDQRYLDAVLAVQLKSHGCSVIDAAITDEFIDGVNAHYRELSPNAIQPTKRQMVYSLCEHLTHLDRMALLRLISKSYETVLYTSKLSEIDEGLLKESSVRVKGTIDYQKEMPQVFMSSKINLNPTLRINRGGISLRCLDIMACKGFMLSSYQEELEEYFADCGIVLYETLEDALEAADYYMRHDEEREQIIENCYSRICERFDYPQRIGEILHCTQ